MTTEASVPAPSPEESQPAGPCKRCGHPYALHSNGRTDCRAFACTAGPDRAPCPGFMETALAVAS